MKNGAAQQWAWRSGGGSRSSRSRSRGYSSVGASHVAVILLDRPEAPQRLHPAIMETLGPLWERLDTDGHTRCIVFGTTSDSFFCSGIDVKEVARTGQAGADLPWGRGPRLTARHAHVFTPVICAVEGQVVGGGMHFVLDADIVVAGQSATFFDTHNKLGMVASGETVGLVVKAGLGAALQFALGGTKHRMDVDRAQELGTGAGGGARRHRVRGCDGVRRARGHRLAQRDKEDCRDRLGGGEPRPRRGAPFRSRSVIGRQRDHPDWREGPRAFAEKRDPVWKDWSVEHRVRGNSSTTSCWTTG